MQFAGQRTDMNLQPIAKPDNFLIKMTPDVLPEPGAVLVHGISPQKTLAEGINEYELCQYLTNHVFASETIAVGYNNIRFDNEFIRFMFWRNFYDPYEWSWKNGCSTWDLLDVVRMTRALRPEGIEWPYGSDGKPTNSLEYLTAVNKLDHADAHDALSDVKASIAMARLLRKKQPKLFEYLLNIRAKSKIAPFVSRGQPLLYTSGRYPADFLKTTVATMAVEKPDKSGALMYDLRIDPDEFSNMPPAELANRWKDWSDDAPYFPVKELKYNRCPSIAPIDALDDESANRLGIHKEITDKHFEKLSKAEGFGARLLEAQELMWQPVQAGMLVDEQKVDELLYEGFIKDEDKPKMSVVRAAEADQISNLELDFSDQRLSSLLPLYKARNFAEILSLEERKHWEEFRRRKLLEGGDKSQKTRYFNQMDELAKTPGMDAKKKGLLEDLMAYGNSVLPKN